MPPILALQLSNEIKQIKDKTMPNDKIKTQADFDHAHQLLSAKIDSALDDINKFARAQGIPSGIIISFETPNPMSIKEDDDHKQCEMVHGVMANVRNPESDLLQAALRVLKHQIIDQPKKDNDIVASMKKAFEIARGNHLNLMDNLHALLSVSEGLYPMLKMLEEAGGSDMEVQKVVAEAMAKAQAGSVH